MNLELEQHIKDTRRRRSSLFGRPLDSHELVNTPHDYYSNEYYQTLVNELNQCSTIYAKLRSQKPSNEGIESNPKLSKEKQEFLNSLTDINSYIKDAKQFLTVNNINFTQLNQVNNTASDIKAELLHII